MRLLRNLPNLLTLLNLLLGLWAIIYIFYDHMLIMDTQRNVYVDMGRMQTAALCVLIAAVIDFFDGFLARLLRAQSAIGQQLDSLADMVTFGVVPGLIMYQLIARSYYASADAFDYPILFYSAGFFLTLCAAWRLARFNTEASSATFYGLPSPTMALVVIALPLIIQNDEWGAADWLSGKWILMGITLALGLLMTSRIPMISLKLHGFGFTANKWSYTLIGASVVLAITAFSMFQLTFVVIPLVIIVYIILSIIKNLVENGI
jgi:CDP-diacylglycerol--serine O-phosphatidyltransferase